MAFPWTAVAASLIPDVLGGLFGGGGDGGASDYEKAQIDYLNKMWQYQEPLAQSAVRTNQMMQPIYGQMAGQLGYLQGIAPGTQWNVPAPIDSSIPSYLRAYANAAPGTWQNELYTRAMYYGPEVSQKRVQDIISDIQNGESPQKRLARENVLPKMNTAAATGATGQAAAPSSGGYTGTTWQEAIDYAKGLISGKPATQQGVTGGVPVGWTPPTSGTLVQSNDAYRFGILSDQDAAALEAKKQAALNSGQPIPTWDTSATPALTSQYDLNSITVPSQSQLPSWMQVPDVDAIVNTLRAGSDVELAQLRQQLSAQTTAGMQGRGLGAGVTSTTGLAQQGNVPLWMMQARTGRDVDLANTKYNMGQQNNQYLQNLQSNLYNQMSGYQAQMMPYTNTLGIANAYGNAAGNAWNQAYQSNQANQQAYGSIGNIIGDWWNQKQNKSQAVNAAQNAAQVPGLTMPQPTGNYLVGGNVPNNYFQNMFGG